MSARSSGPPRRRERTATPEPPRDLTAWLEWQQRHYRSGMNFLPDSLPTVRRVAARLRLGAPAVPLILVAGTNGKGSIVAFLEALALAHGLRPGCYSSPWLLRYNESVRIGGDELSDEAIVESFLALEAARDEEPLTVFEARALAAADAIRTAGVQLAVMEVGLGGRLDAVNVFDPDVAVVASVGMDHCDILGNTLERIAHEKAGIMRCGRPAVGADPDSNRWLGAAADALGATFYGAQEAYRFGRAGDGWWWRGAGRELGDLPIPALLGEHQLANAAGAIMAFSLAVGRLVPEAVARALARVRLRGRLERVPGRQRRWVDVAHNPPAACALAHWLAREPGAAPWHAVCAMRAGKDLQGTLREVAPHVAHWYLAGLPRPEGAPVEALGAALEQVHPGASVRTFHDVRSAWQAASRGAGGRDRLLAFGSFATAREVLLLESDPASPDTARER